MTRFTVSLLLSLAVSGLSFARPGDRDGSRRWEVQPQLLNTKDGATYRVTGNMPGMPDGATLHITLTTPGTGSVVLKAAFFKVTVKNESFAGSFHWPKQAFAPLVYTTTVDLYVQTQPAAVRRMLMQEYGYPATGRETIAEEVTELGTAEERVKFSVKSLGEMSDLTDEARVLQGEFAQVMGLPADQWEKVWKEECDPKVQAFQQVIQQFKLDYVVRREADLIESLRTCITMFYDFAQARKYRPEEDLSEQAGALSRELDAIDAEIESRLPLGSLENEQLDDEGEE